MSENLKFLSVSWRVQIPKRRYLTNGRYLFQGGEWYMDCGVESDCIFLDVFGISCSDIPTVDAPWSIYIMVRGGEDNGRVLEELCHRDLYYCPKEDNTWRRRTCDIERVCPEFRSNRILTFIVTIDAKTSGSPQSGMVTTDTQTVRESSDASIQTQCVPPSTDQSEPQPKSPVSTMSCLESLSVDLIKLLDEELDPDVEFQCDGLSTKAHRTVVTARSPVLAKMLKSDMVEGRTGIVKIQDMEADTFRQFLRYLYSGELEELTFQTAVPLYEAADQYEVRTLASRCSEFITTNLSGENAYDALIVADTHSDSKFVEAAVDYMVKKKFPLSNDRWSSFCEDQPRLANKVVNRFCLKSKWTGWEN